MRAFFFALALIAASVASGCAQQQPPQPTLTIATTTSVGNSGLLEALTTAYRDQAGVEIRAHLVGSGRALELLASATVPLIVSHAPDAEATHLARHAAWQYRKIMFNDFVVVGPPDDPARAGGADSVQAAMRRIASSSTRFISRGDRSGTHERERALWAAAGAAPPANRLIVAGAGMGATLRIAAETRAYTLTDRATFEQHRGALAIVFEGGPALLNTYAVMWNPGHEANSPARAFAEWLSDGPGRDVIERFGARGTKPFTVWPRTAARNTPTDLPFER